MPEGKSEYPADVAETANNLVQDLVAARANTYEVRVAIAKALLAEREACAKIAKRYEGDPDWPGETWIAGAISEAILHRGEPSA